MKTAATKGQLLVQDNGASWQPRWALQKALHASVEWHQQWLAGANMKAFTMAQIDQYQ